MQSYDQKFFADQTNDSSISAREMAPLVLKLVNPRRLIDVGCGVGAWLAEFRKQGVADAFGIDGDYVNRDMLMVPKECFAAHDLTKPYPVDKTYDLAVSLEVAEHLPESCAGAFVDLLTSLSPVVLFSAAVPGQGGTLHLNEQWPDYWGGLFAARGYIMIDSIRPRLWQNHAVRWWYKQNAFMYVRSDMLANYPALEQDLAAGAGGLKFPMRLVHPEMYLGLHYASDPKYMSGSTAWAQFKTVMKRAMGQRLKKLLPGRNAQSNESARSGAPRPGTT